MTKLKDAAKKAESKPAKSVPHVAMPKGEPEMDKYTLDSKLITLLEAQEIMEDKDLMSKLRAHHDKKTSKIDSIAKLREAAKSVDADEAV